MSSAPELVEKYANSAAEEPEEHEGLQENPSVDENNLSYDSLVKRKASPFTSTMDVALATAFTTEKNILDGTYRAEGVPTRQQKLAAWERIRDCVNAFSGDANLKTVQQCKDRHRNLIQAVRFKRSSGFLEGPLPAPISSKSPEGNDQQVSATNNSQTQNDATGNESNESHTTTLPSRQNGVPSTSSLSLSPKEPRRPMKRPSSAVSDFQDDYHKRKLAIMIKEHIVRVELMKAQTEYYRTKTDLMVKHSCNRPSSTIPPKVPSHSQPLFPGNT